MCAHNAACRNVRNAGAAHPGYMCALRHIRHDRFSSGTSQTNSATAGLNEENQKTLYSLCRQQSRRALYCSEPGKLLWRMLCKMPPVWVAAAAVVWSSALVATEARALHGAAGMEAALKDFDAGLASAPGPASADLVTDGPQSSFSPGVHDVHAWPWPIVERDCVSSAYWGDGTRAQSHGHNCMQRF